MHTVKLCLPRSTVRKTYQGVTDTTILKGTQAFIDNLEKEAIRSLKANPLVREQTEADNEHRIPKTRPAAKRH